MATNCGDLKENGCELESFEKNNYFYGKLISARDMTLEQRTNERKLYTINRLVLGSGLVCGLNTSFVKDESGNLVIDKDGNVMVTIEPGLAIDGCGRLIVVSAQYKATFPANHSSPIYFYIKYRNCSREAVPISGKDDACQENCCYNRIREVFDIVYSDKDLLLKKEKDEKKTTNLKNIEDKINKDSSLDIAQVYYDEVLKSGCTNTSEYVLLGVFKKNDSGNWVLDTTEIHASRSIVYDNVMLYDIINTLKDEIKVLNDKINNLSTQTPKVKVPNIVCKNKPCDIDADEAESIITGAKLVMGKPPNETETNEDDLVGFIHKTDPPVDELVNEGTTVNIWVYKKKEVANQFIVPSVVGLHEGISVNEELKKYGINVGNTEYVFAADFPHRIDPLKDEEWGSLLGTVKEQSPKAGPSNVEVKTVDISVYGLKMQNYVGKSMFILSNRDPKRDNRNWVEIDGFKIKSISPEISTNEEEVISQEPMAGKIVKLGQEVTFNIN